MDLLLLGAMTLALAGMAVTASIGGLKPVRIRHDRRRARR